MTDRFEQFCNAIAGIQHAINKIERLEMEKYGLKGPHAQCLLSMLKHPEGITSAMLCDFCKKDKAAISRTVSELEDAGMITRFDPLGKRYRTQLYLTEKGKVIAQDVEVLVHRTVSRVSGGYDVETRDGFVLVLSQMAASLQNLSEEMQRESNGDKQ